MIFFGKRKQLENEVAALKEHLSQIQNVIPSSDLSPDSTVWKSFTSGSETYSGSSVTEKTAMSISAVYACVGLIAGAISGMPLPIYQKTGTGREKVGEHSLAPLLNDQANDAWSAPVFWEYGITSMLLQGDKIAKILRPSKYSPEISGFEPLHPACVTVKKIDGRLKYVIWNNDDPEVLDQDDVLHIPGLGFNGLRGMSQIHYAYKNSIGTAIAAEQYSGTFFKNGARPDFALTSEGDISPEQAELIRKTWYDRYQGAGNAHLPAILKGGLKVEQLTMTAEDAQLISTRQFQVEDIARFFGVPPHMIGHTEKTTSWGSGLEQQSIGFVVYTLGRHIKKIEKEINRKCLSGPRDKNLYCEFNTSGLVRGDIKTRNEAYRIALGRAGEPAWMKVNEVRKLENLPPVEGGDVLYTGDNNAPNDETANQ